MLAWPSNSCTARRSPLDCSRWLANEWRSMCGCTGVARPASRLRRFRRCQMAWAVRRVPWRPTKSAACSRLPPCSRNASQRSSASSALRPTGTVRRLLPLPSTWASPACRSIQPRGCAARHRVQPHQFAHAQAAAVQQFHHGRIARFQPGVGLVARVSRQLHRIVDAQRLGQRLGRLGRAHVLHRIAGRPAPAGPARRRSRASPTGSARCRGRCGRRRASAPPSGARARSAPA